MSDKKIKIVLFITLLLLLLGIVNATNVTDNTNTNVNEIIDNTENNIETTNLHDYKIDNNEDIVNNIENTDLKTDNTNETMITESDILKKSVKESNKTATKIKPTFLKYPRSGDAKGDTIYIEGQLLSGNRGIEYQNVTIIVNNEVYIAKTGYDGTFRTRHIIDSYKDLKVTFKYYGNYYYEAIQDSITYYVIKAEFTSYNNDNLTYGKTTEIRGKLQYNRTGIEGETINITVNNKNYTATTGENGYFTINHTIDSYDNLKVEFKYAGSSQYNSASISKTYYVQKPTNLFMYTRNGDTKGSTIKVSGKLLYNETGIVIERINITVNNKNYTALTGGYGYFTVNHTIDSYDDLNVTFKYAGSSQYLPTQNSTVYPVKKPTTLYMYEKGSLNYGTTTEISGNLLCNNTGIQGESINITVNNKEYTATTGENGYFTINHTIDSYDNLIVNFKYAGSSQYLPTQNSRLYTVKKPTTLYMYEKGSLNYGTTTKISGKLQYNEIGIERETINITVNNKNYTATTGGYGYFTINHTIDSYDNLIVNFKYAGSSQYYSTEDSIEYLVKKPTNIYMYTRNGDKIGTTIKVSGKLQYNETGIKGETVNIKVNNKKYIATTGGYGYFTINHTIDSYDNLKVEFKYPGTSMYESTTNTTVYPVIKPTNLYMYTRNGDKIGTTIKVSGKLQFNGNGVKGELVNITVNGAKYSATTGGYGYFTINHTITSHDDLNVKFTYAGSTNYLASENSTVYPVNGPTSLFIYSRSGDAKGSTIKVSGKLLCDGEGVKGEKVTIKVNDKTYTATSGGYGYFTVKHKITSYDNLNIAMSYAGSSKYEPTSNSTVYKVKQPTNLYMYSRSNDKVGSTIKVSGKLLNNNSEGIKGEKVKINVNGKTYTATTGGYGYFTVNYTITTNANLNITFTYDGSKVYESTTNSTIYTVVQGNTKLTINSVSNINYNKNVTITGKLTDSNNNPLKQTKISVNFNGVEKQVTTDDNGVYTFTNQTNKVGSNTITVNFTENNNYLSSNNKVTFKVINKPTILDFDVFDVEYGENATIIGYLVDNDRINLINTPVTININGGNYYTKRTVMDISITNIKVKYQD